VVNTGLNNLSIHKAKTGVPNKNQSIMQDAMPPAEDEWIGGEFGSDSDSF